MKLNMGGADRLIRILIALGIAILYGAGMISGTPAIVLAVLAAVLLVTGLTGRCPGYVPFGLSTRSE